MDAAAGRFPVVHAQVSRRDNRSLIRYLQYVSIGYFGQCSCSEVSWRRTFYREVEATYR